MPKTILHTAESRGTANFGWLHSRHTFSFGDYYSPERLHFGALRVLNDDMVAPGKGFGTHPHNNMEIISIPLEGDLEHKDSMNNVSVIRQGDIQVMSAGTGILHSEYNKNKDRSVKFLQIWVIPKIQQVKPRYDQITYVKSEIKNQLHEILSPSLNDGTVWIHQDAWFNLGKIEAGNSLNYTLNRPEKNGVYVFVLDGELNVNDQPLKSRDGYGLWELTDIEFNTKTNSEFLIMEVPMNV